MDISKLSIPGLHSLHQAVIRALAEDDEATKKGEEPPHGVRQYDDWRQWADALEEELEKRKESFDKVRW